MALTAGGLTDSIKDAFGEVWSETKGGAAPTAGAADRELLFAAVARGVLDYLKANQDELIERLTVQEDGGGARDLTVTDARLGIDG